MMATPRVTIARAEISEQFIVSCPHCQARLALESQVLRRTGWRRFMPLPRAPLLVCLSCHAILDPELPRGRRILKLQLMPQLAAGITAGVEGLNHAGVEAPVELEPAEPAWESEPDIMQYRRRRRGNEPLSREQSVFRERIISQLKASELAVPMMPQVAAELSRLFRSSEVNIGRVLEVVARDPMITATLLKLANSALYRSERPSQSLKEAIERLGFAQVEGVVYSVTLSCKVLRFSGYGYDARRLHQHALGVAILARMIAGLAGMDGGQAFMAGILHDIGKVVILDACHNVEKGVRPPGAERVVHELMDLHHGRLGGVLCVRWALPQFLLPSLQRHHEMPADRDSEPFGPLINLADNLAHVLGLGVTPVRIRVAEHPALAALGLSGQQILTVLEDFQFMRDDYEALSQIG